MFERIVPISDILLYLGGGLAIIGGGITKVFMWAQGDAMMIGGTTVAMMAGLVAAVTPLVLRVVDLQRLRDNNKRLNKYIAAIEERAGAVDAENRKLREFIVRSSLEYKYALPEWFYAEPPSGLGTGEHQLLLPPDSSEAPKEKSS